MTLDPIVVGIVIAIAVVVIIVVLIMLFTGRRSPGREDAPAFTTGFQNLTQTIQLGQAQINILTEKLNRLEPMIKSIGSIETGFADLGERVLKIEKNQTLANQGLGAIAAGLAQSESNITSQVGKSQQESLQSLYVVGNDLSEELTRIQAELNALQAGVKAREEIDHSTSESIRRLETLIAGAHAGGAGDEHVLDAMFARLPADWQARNFSVNGTQVDFGLRLPNRLILPIDGAWRAGDLLEQFSAASDAAEQRRLKAQIEDALLQKAREVTLCIEPGVTVGFGVAAVPDAVYDLCGGVRAEVFQMNVVVVSYSLFMPYLLLVFQTILKGGQNIDLQKWEARLRTLQDSILALQEELDGRFFDAITLLNHSRDEMRAQLSKADAGISGLQTHTTTTHENSFHEAHEEPQRGLW
jgi:DNA recombination protein RmuC